MSHLLTEITDEDFTSLRHTTGVVVVKLYKTNCGPCNILAPRIEELATEFKGRAVFLAANIESSPKLAASLLVRSFPAVAILKDGVVKSAVVGAKLTKFYREQIEALL